ncbi:MAG: MBL fold metallo-hydrolase [Crocinitomicaceae bacterium]|jgi:glyoxylase-like metal-dependent hydrolase (beta-lactamase superfamily II)
MALLIQKFSFNGFQENTYIVQDGYNCVIIDPGCYEKHEQDELMNYITLNNLNPAALLLTHAHIDHVLGCSFVLSKFEIDFYMHKEDTNTLNAVSDYAHVYGYPGYSAPSAPNKVLKHGDVLSFGDIQLEVKFTPGHSAGHVVFYNEEAGFVINGDVLFAGSFGRTDLPGGDIEILKGSIHNIMFKLPEETVVYCGHGGETTIGQEKRTNHILQF